MNNFAPFNVFSYLFLKKMSHIVRDFNGHFLMFYVKKLAHGMSFVRKIKDICGTNCVKNFNYVIYCDIFKKNVYKSVLGAIE